MPNPFVSVCMITFNHEKFIAEAIEGILMQEVDFDVELLIADDCSTDRTQEIVKSFIDNHPKGNWIKFISHDQNKGMMSNFIWAITECKGDFIALCEGDDYWIESRKLKFQLEFLSSNLDYFLVGHQVQKISFQFEGFRILGNLQRDSYCLNDPDYHFLAIPTASIFFRNKLKFPDWVSKVYGGDRALIFLASHFGKIKIMDFVGAVYRVHPGGIEQKYKLDKISLPKRNLLELPVYFELARPHFKKYIAKKMSWNNLFLALRYALSWKIIKSLNHLGKSFLWKIRSI